MLHLMSEPLVRGRNLGIIDGGNDMVGMGAFKDPYYL